MSVMVKGIESDCGRNTTGLLASHLMKKLINARRAAISSVYEPGDDIDLEEIVLEYLMSDHGDGNESNWDVLDVTGGIPSNVKEINSAELWKAIRKMSNKNVKCVVKTLRKEKSLVFKDLIAITGLNPNDLNHALYDLKQLNLVIQLDDKKYYLTKYCVALLSSLKFLKEILNGISREEAISPYTNNDK